MDERSRRRGGRPGWAWHVGGACLGVLAALGSGPARAQTASQITPPWFSPPLQRQGGAILIPEGQGPEAPAGAENLSVRVRRLDVQGGLPPLAGLTDALQARLSGRAVSAAEIFAAARELEQAYAAAGFALVRVVLPTQQLRDDGDVRLLVVDGIVERIDVSALPPEIRGRVAAILAPLVGTRGLTLTLLERKLLLAGDTPGTVLRSTLAPGRAAGASVLVVEARYKAVTGFTGIDNGLADSLGRYTASLGFDFNSPTGNGEVLYVRSFGLPITGGSAAFLGADPRNRALATGLILPLGTDGLTLTLEATDTRTTPRALPGTVGFASEFSRYSARLRYPLVRSRDFTLNTEAAFDAQEERVNIRVPVEAPFSLDRLRVARGATDLLWFLPTEGVLTGRLGASFGLDGLGARNAPPLGATLPALSRQGARPEFQKLEAALSLTQPLAEHLTLDVRARAQTSFNQALARSEQIGIANLSGLSAFDSGLLQGDEGFVTRGELQFPFIVPVTLPFGLPSIPALQGSGLPPADQTPGAVVLSPYGFGAYGLVRQQLPTALERPMVRGLSYGVGLRIAAAPSFSFTNAAVTVEYGRSARSDRLPTDNRLTFSVALQF
ncbi:ShlB/FhaC/HecB family hemolysin secretion/activation protein [Methylobacterium terricola]|uniref:ShlB/FhaC/HecB family hemolysin secretion/activation protein n=1 Tax=Methylobacterium terricola TaxID=2583531 RepID=A0A5C4LBS2_9HYPH|nr:ShlB/FhaC/HecB family hemolysin secretion/activation protein [Methylobacterium terricola]TNC09918.1 ShlB/FhaC/HecB family hemolysin secretion/activation protein [Methylobacterium terricola]